MRFAFKTSLALMMAMGASAQAQEMGRVLQSTPMYQQVASPQRLCDTATVTVPGQKSGAGAVMGAVAGGAVGNAVGQGSGRALATVIGVVGGAVLGDRIEGSGPSHTQPVTQCHTQYVYENRLLGYQVTYEYGGKQYQVQWPHDPGSHIPLQVVPLVPGMRPVQAYPVSQPTMALPTPVPLQAAPPMVPMAPMPAAPVPEGALVLPPGR